MGRNKLLIGGIVIVAAIVIAYFAFLYPPANKEDTSGAIGVANKYRNEQITDKDVILKDEEAAAAAAMAVMSPDEKAAMFERSTFDLQARTLVQYAPEVLAGALVRADDATLAKIVRGADAQTRVLAFSRLTPDARAALCKNMGITMEQYSKLDMAAQAEKLAKCPDIDLARIVKENANQGKSDILAKADLACQRDILTLLSRDDKIAAMKNAPATVVNEMERANFTTRFFDNNVAPEQRFDMLAKSPEVLAGALVRADDATLAKIVRGADAQTRVLAFSRLTPDARAALCKNMGITMEQYSKLDMAAQAEKLAKCPDIDLARIVKENANQGKSDILAKADLACQRDILTLLSRDDKIAAMKNAPATVVNEMERANFTTRFFDNNVAPEQRFDMLAKSPEVLAGALVRADDATLAKIVRGADAQTRVLAFSRLTPDARAALCKNMGITMEQYSKLDMAAQAEKLAKCPDIDLARIVKENANQGKSDILAKADLACQRDILTLLSRDDKIAAMKNASPKVTEGLERAYGQYEKGTRAQE